MLRKYSVVQIENKSIYNHKMRLICFDTHSHSLRVDEHGPPKSERLSIVTPSPKQALSEVLTGPFVLALLELLFLRKI